MNNDTVMIVDNTGVLWSSSGPAAREEGLSILHAAEQGQKRGYTDAIGEKWSGDLILVQEIARIR